ncbi:MAG TPA: AI-2E family transporter [Gemmatimonadales bacterium]|nr:AI-2E family transporter [Gemmatimonadales bacterium]
MVTSPVFRYTLITAAVIVVIAGLRAAAALFTPFALAVFIAVVSLPAVRFLRRRLRFPSGLAILGIVVLVAVVLAFFSWIVMQTAVELRAELPAYLARAQELEQSVRTRLLPWGLDLGPRDSSNFFEQGRVFDFAATAARGVTSAASVFFLILLFLVFILAESIALPDKLRRVYGPKTSGQASGAVVLAQVQRYLVLKTLISLVTGIVIGAGAALIGVDFALFWGLLAFVLNYVPNIGSVIAAVPAVLVALLQLGVGPALGLSAIYLSVNMVVGNFVDPIVIGRELRLSPLIVLMSLVFWGWVWGPVGMFLSVPLTIVVRIVMENTDSLKRVANMMGPVAASGSGNPAE